MARGKIKYGKGERERQEELEGIEGQGKGKREEEREERERKCNILQNGKTDFSSARGFLGNMEALGNRSPETEKTSCGAKVFRQPHRKDTILSYSIT